VEFCVKLNKKMGSSKNYNDKELKDQGNKLFASRKLDEAIDCYTKAILKNPSVPHYYTNRALCYLNQKRWPQAISDSKLALEKDPSLVKGHFYLGKNLYNNCPRAQDPKSPRAQEPKSPIAQEPKSPRAKEPKSQRAKEPKSLGAKEPRSLEAQEPKIPRAQEPKSQRAQEPKSPRAQEPKSQRA
jgi:tetratricopeptide (TPR) repeat protein